MKAGDALLVLTYDLLGRAYEAVQALPEGVSVAELIPAAGETTLALTGTAASLVLLSETLPRPSSSRFIDQVPAEVIESWLGLSNPPLESQLAIFETDSVADAFEAAVRLHKAGLQPFDLRLLRGAQVKAYVLATGRTDALGLQDLNGTLTLIPAPSAPLREFFEISPH